MLGAPSAAPPRPGLPPLFFLSSDPFSVIFVVARVAGECDASVRQRSYLYLLLLLHLIIIVVVVIIIIIIIINIIIVILLSLSLSSLHKWHADAEDAYDYPSSRTQREGLWGVEKSGETGKGCSAVLYRRPCLTTHNCVTTRVYCFNIVMYFTVL